MQTDRCPRMSASAGLQSERISTRILGDRTQLRAMHKVMLHTKIKERGILYISA
jgi:hypothetical protein